MTRFLMNFGRESREIITGHSCISLDNSLLPKSYLNGLKVYSLIENKRFLARLDNFLVERIGSTKLSTPRVLA